MYYCSTCGIRIPEGLSYCKNCGSKVTRPNADDKTSYLEPESLLSAMTKVFVLGLITIVVMMGVMKAVLGLTVETILVFTLIPFLMMAVLEGVFIRMLFRGNRAREQAGKKIVSTSENATNELDPAQARVLPEPLTSVTEHTTRAFDPVYAERGRQKDPSS